MDGSLIHCQLSFCLEWDIENVTNFCGFYKALVLQSLWDKHFFKLADNGLYGCIGVVVMCERKIGPFLGYLGRGRVRFWLAGGTGQKDTPTHVL